MSSLNAVVEALSDCDLALVCQRSRKRLWGAASVSEAPERLGDLPDSDRREERRDAEIDMLWSLSFCVASATRSNLAFSAATISCVTGSILII